MISTASLLFTVLAVGDNKSLKIPIVFQPILMGFVVAVHCTVFGLNEGAPLNPARDLAPRIFISLSGWGKQAFE